ncbi:MAG: DUF4863 family protein [Acidimicrobiia bacterium]|nr:DUF4863 family protein [Acidimicrobiia bacterium]
MIETFRPLFEAAAGLDLSDPEAARAELARRLDPESEDARDLGRELVGLFEAGQLADRGDWPVRWGRVSKAVPATLEHSIDVVVMTGAGPAHRHPGGEVNWCVPMEGAPTFEGCGAGWVVMPPDSVHVPTVEGGKMLIVYLLPGGRMEFLEKP